MNAAAGVPARPLVLLVVAVLAAHLLVLHVAPLPLSWTTGSRDSSGAAVVHLQLPASSPAAPAAAVQPAAQTRRPAKAARASAKAVAAPAAASIAASAPPLAAAPAPLTAPAAARWRYAVLALRQGVLLEGQAALDWRPADGAYEAVLTIDVPGLQRREQRSTGEVLAGEGLRPLRYSDRARTEQAAHFERGAGQVLFSGNQPSVALETGAQDRLSVVLQLLALARAEPSRFAPGASVSLQVAGARAADAWTFEVDRWETLEVPAGRVRAVRLTRAPARDYDLRMELWLAPDYGPVRLRLTPPNGDWLDLQWSGTDKG